MKRQYYIGNGSNMLLWLAEVLLNARDKFDPSYNLSFADVASDSCTKPSIIQLTLTLKESKGST